MQMTEKNYSFTDYKFDKATVRYIVMNDTKATFMLIFPSDIKNKLVDRFESVKLQEKGFPNNCDWFAVVLVHLHLSHHYTPMYENSYKMSESTKS